MAYVDEIRVQKRLNLPGSADGIRSAQPKKNLT